MVLHQASVAPASSNLVSVSAETLLHGAFRVEHEPGGWLRPWRFTNAQLRMLGSCQAWHPGLFRQMARATAGVRLEFETDSSEVVVEFACDGEPSGTRAVLAAMDDMGESELRAHDGISARVDGRSLGVLAMHAGQQQRIVLVLDDPSQAPAGMIRLPSMGDIYHVQVWLPCLRGCRLRSVAGNGSFIRPCSFRPRLLVLGDSIAQGFIAEDPASCWTVLVAEQLGLDLINQSVGGQVFQPGMVSDLPAHSDVAAIIVELGENYRYEPCHPGGVSRDIGSFLVRVSGLWPKVPTWVLSPLWHNERKSPSHPKSCFEQLDGLLQEHLATHKQMIFVDGSQLLDHDSKLMADGYEHPGPAGQRQIANRLGSIIASGSNTFGNAMPPDLSVS